MTLVLLAMTPGVGLLIWVWQETRSVHREELRRAVIELAQLAAEGQARRHEAGQQLLAALSRNAAVRSARPEFCQPVLVGLVRDFPDVYTNFGLLDPQGVSICVAITSPGRSATAGDRWYFRETRRTGRFTVGGLTVGRITGRRAVNFARALTDEPSLGSVLFASLAVEAIQAMLERVRLPEGGVLLLLDRWGAIVAKHEAASKRAGGGAPPSPAKLVRAASPAVFEAAGADGVQRLYASVAVDVDRSMFAVAGLPIARATQAADQSFIAALWVLGGAMVVVFAMTATFANQDIRRPIVALLEAASRLGDGDLTARVTSVRGASELRELAAGFNRTADMLQARELQGRQAQRLEAIGQLAGGVAHDFNNILTVIIGFGEELSDLVKSPAARAAVTEVLAAAERAKQLTHQLLAFSRRQILQPKPLHLNDVIANMSTMLRRVIGEDITLVTKLGSDLGIVLVDPTQVEQVLLNLVVNARDAMPNGGLLTIETDTVEFKVPTALPSAGDTPLIAAGTYVRLAISDSGCGMDEETQVRMFEPFFSTKGSTGTGLGLSTVYGIVKQSGGYIGCASKVNHGTTFFIYLPVCTHASPECTAASAPAGAPAYGTETILLVEDEPAVRSLAGQVLKRYGYTVVEAADGASAMTHVRGGVKPDLVVTDVVLPGINGRQLAADVRRQWPDTRVLYMSGYDSHAALHQTVDALRFLRKPFTPAVLLDEVRKALDG